MCIQLEIKRYGKEIATAREGESEREFTKTNKDRETRNLRKPFMCVCALIILALRFIAFESKVKSFVLHLEEIRT